MYADTPTMGLNGAPEKTGDPVDCPIPPHVAEVLQNVPQSQKGNTNERYFFLDTFAVEALLSGMRLEKVSIILGHSSVKITEKHCMPWLSSLSNGATSLGFRFISVSNLLPK